MKGFFYRRLKSSWIAKRAQSQDLKLRNQETAKKKFSRVGAQQMKKVIIGIGWLSCCRLIFF